MVVANGLMCHAANPSALDPGANLSMLFVFVLRNSSLSVPVRVGCLSGAEYSQKATEADHVWLYHSVQWVSFLRAKRGFWSCTDH